MEMRIKRDIRLAHYLRTAAEPSMNGLAEVLQIQVREVKFLGGTYYQFTSLPEYNQTLNSENAEVEDEQDFVTILGACMGENYWVP